MRSLISWVALTLVVVPSAYAVTININAGAGLAGNADALAAFNRAADSWEAVFTDLIVVNIDANLVPLGAGILGQASSVRLGAGYNTIRDAMVLDAADEASNGIVASLPTLGQYSAYVPVGFGLSAALLGTKANLKALGFGGLDGMFGATDATIEFSSTFGFDFDNSNGVGAGLYDFETVAAHEIGHALGFISQVDEVDVRVATNLPNNIIASTLDMFRFGNTTSNPTSVAEFTANPRMLVPGVAANFDDLTNEWAMSTGAFTGDGRQASHWKDDGLTANLIGIMDPTLGTGFISPITAADIRALDLIGWDVAAVPEPAAIPVIALGIGGILWYRARKQRLS